MPRLLVNLGVICLACLTCGCGNYINTVGLKNAHEDRIYGGVRVDVEAETTIVKEAIDRPEAIILELPILTAMYLIDLPLSFVADTLTLPWVIYRQAAAPPKTGAAAKKETDKKVDDSVADGAADK